MLKRNLIIASKYGICPMEEDIKMEKLVQIRIDKSIKDKTDDIFSKMDYQHNKQLSYF